MTAAKARPVPLPEGGPVVASSGLGLLPKGLLVLLVLATLVSDTVLTHYDILMSVGPGAVLVAVLAETVGRASPVTEHALTSPPSLQFKRFSFEVLNFLSHRPPLESMRRVENIRVPSRGNHSVPVRLYTPYDDSQRGEDGALPLIVWVHGGGWTLGSVRGDDRMARAFAKASGAMVASIEYRLAPEHRWPAPLEDVVDAVAHLLDHAQAYSLDTHRVALAGESAGGHLTILTALSLSLSHPGLLCGMVPIVPPTMYGCTFASCDAFARGRLLHKDHVEHFWNITVPPHLAQHHSVSPLRAPRELLSRLPSTLILTADQDPLQDEGEAFYERVLESGVAAQHVRYNKTIHLFFGRVSTGGAQSMHHVSNWFKDTCGCPRAARARVARYTRMQRGESPYPLIL